MDSFLKQYCSPEWQKFIDFHKKSIEVEELTIDEYNNVKNMIAYNGI